MMDCSVGVMHRKQRTWHISVSLEVIHAIMKTCTWEILSSSSTSFLALSPLCFQHKLSLLCKHSPALWLFFFPPEAIWACRCDRAATCDYATRSHTHMAETRLGLKHWSSDISLILRELNTRAQWRVGQRVPAAAFRQATWWSLSLICYCVRLQV